MDQLPLPEPRLIGTRRRRVFAKRVMDLVTASTAAVALSPIIAGIALLIRSKRDGPAIYRGRRVGLRGRIFEMYKFRTMVTNAELLGGPSTPDDDHRLTPIGRRLRRYKLDELPQLFNVIKGDMSLVGPRPQVITEVSNYTPEERLLLLVRPGLTDWASLRFHNEGDILRGAADPDQAYAERIRPEKMRLGLAYVRTARLRDDLIILRDTVALILGRPHRINTESHRGLTDSVIDGSRVSRITFDETHFAPTIARTKD